MRWCFLLMMMLGFNFSHAQNYVSLHGEITNPDQDFVTFTLYRSWHLEPETYRLKLSDQNKWIVELPLNEIAYCDLSFGANSLNMIKMEPDDDITLRFDNEDFYNSLSITGKGSHKWNLQMNLFRKYQQERNLDLEYSNVMSLNEEQFYEKLNELKREQLSDLENDSEWISEAYYKLEKADFTGQLKLRELGYFNLKNISIDSLKIPEDKDKIASKSFFLSQFYETAALTYIDEKISELPKDLEVEYIKSLDALFPKFVIEKILSERIHEKLMIAGNNEETKLQVFSFLIYSDNELLNERVKGLLSRGESLQIGKMAPNFILKNKRGKYVSLSDFRGKHLILGFYENNCVLCLDDFEAFKIVDNYFKKQGQRDLAFVFVNTSQRSDFKNFFKKNKVLGEHLNGHNDRFLENNYFIDILPEYYLIDSNGRVVANSIADPSADQGRALIRFLSDNIFKK